MCIRDSTGKYCAQPCARLFGNYQRAANHVRETSLEISGREGLQDRPQLIRLPPDYFFDVLLDAILHLPIRKVRMDLAEIGDVANMIADAIFIHEMEFKFMPQLIKARNCLKDGDAVFPSAA